MTRLVRLLLVVLVAGLTAPGAALGKGASEATITGPGIGDGITLAGDEQPSGEELMRIAEHAGFFQAVFTQSPNPMLTERPEGELGPRYTIAYTMPGPSAQLDVLRQELYPYAKPEPVTYMEPAQAYWTDQQTVGGWYVADTILLDELVAVGLPQTAPTVSPDTGGVPWTPIAAAVLAVLTAALVALALRSRRGSGPQPA